MSLYRNEGSLAKDVLHQAAQNGDVFLPTKHLVDLCYSRNHKMGEAEIYAEISALEKAKEVVIDADDSVYLADNYRYEQTAAELLAQTLEANDTSPSITLEASLAAAEAFLPVQLDDSQRDAVRTVMNHTLTVITGGAGSGKTTLIHALWLVNKLENDDSAVLLCAPTGKASRNLEEKTNHAAYTVHKALGKFPDSDFLSGEEMWGLVKLVIVDEASMVTLEMLAGLLQHIPEACRLVFVGDPHQLLSVGAGNVLGDVLALGFPNAHLAVNYRQKEGGSALLCNLNGLANRWDTTLEFDKSFELIHAYSMKQAEAEICRRYPPFVRFGFDAQVLTPFRKSAEHLGQLLQEVINPPTDKKREVRFRNTLFREGDRVMLTRNTQEHCNGDLGEVRFEPSKPSPFECGVSFDGRDRRFYDQFRFVDLLLAYALTIHKAQGSEYDVVLLPILRDYNVMLTQNLLYTAISRAKSQVILVGDEGAIHKALVTPPKPRNSALVRRTKQCLQCEKRKIG